MSDNAKFWISIIAAFTLPLLSYTFWQGQTSRSIDIIIEKQSALEKQVEGLSDKVHTLSTSVETSNAIVKRIDLALSSIDFEVKSHSREIAVLQLQYQSLKGGG